MIRPRADDLYYTRRNNINLPRKQIGSGVVVMAVDKNRSLNTDTHVINGPVPACAYCDLTSPTIKRIEIMVGKSRGREREPICQHRYNVSPESVFLHVRRVSHYRTTVTFVSEQCASVRRFCYDFISTLKTIYPVLRKDN